MLKLEQRAKRCIELRGEYAEYIPSSVAVAFFLPVRAKDLSAAPHMSVSSGAQSLTGVQSALCLRPPTVLSMVHNHDPWLCNNFYAHQATSTRIREVFNSAEAEI